MTGPADVGRCLWSGASNERESLVGKEKLWRSMQVNKMKESTTFGRVSEGQWVFGGVCRETQNCFMVLVKKPDNDTLLHVIKEQVETGTTITLVSPPSRRIRFRSSDNK